MYSKWLNSETVFVQGMDYVTINKTEPVFYQPWIEPIEVNGTDGNQFHPNVAKDEQITAFVSNFANSAHFNYKNSEPTSTYQSVDPHGSLEIMNFYLAESDMQNQDKNPKNKNFNTVYDGTVNLSTVNRADSIGTKGHFY